MDQGGKGLGPAKSPPTTCITLNGKVGYSWAHFYLWSGFGPLHGDPNTPCHHGILFVHVDGEYSPVSTMRILLI